MLGCLCRWSYQACASCSCSARYDPRVHSFDYCSHLVCVYLSRLARLAQLQRVRFVHLCVGLKQVLLLMRCSQSHDGRSRACSFQDQIGTIRLFSRAATQGKRSRGTENTAPRCLNQWKRARRFRFRFQIQCQTCCCGDMLDFVVKRTSMKGRIHVHFSGLIIIGLVQVNLHVIRCTRFVGHFQHYASNLIANASTSLRYAQRSDSFLGCLLLTLLSFLYLSPFLQVGQRAKLYPWIPIRVSIKTMNILLWAA